MRLSEWRAKAPFKNSVSPKVVAVIDSALAILGTDRDPECWVLWGDDPTVRYLILAPSPSGLVQVNVRVYLPGEGPRASGKVVRWNRVQLGELVVEIQGGHRLVTFQVEMQVLTGADDPADRIAAFAQSLFAAADGRAGPPSAAPKAASQKANPGTAGRARSGAGSSAATKASPAQGRPSKASPGAATAVKARSNTSMTGPNAEPRRNVTKGPRP